MSAYVIVEVEVCDVETYDAYRRLVPASLEAYGGRFLARGGAIESLEGDWRPERIVVLEFPSLEVAVEWWRSPEYRDAKALRARSARTRMIATQGV